MTTFGLEEEKKSPKGSAGRTLSFCDDDAANGSLGEANGSLAVVANGSLLFGLEVEVAAANGSDDAGDDFLSVEDAANGSDDAGDDFLSAEVAANGSDGAGDDFLSVEKAANGSDGAANGSDEAGADFFSLDGEANGSSAALEDFLGGANGSSPDVANGSATEEDFVVSEDAAKGSFDCGAECLAASTAAANGSLEGGADVLDD